MQAYGPVRQFKVGCIEAAIFEGRSEHEALWCVGIRRLYNEGDQLKVTAEFRRSDMPTVAKVWDMACAWIWEQFKAATQDEAAA